ncbi:sulfur carrier protein ThiS [Gracilibacillus halophilus YIM-C55.5]|uniref:Sulfur carrier protein ThiS n=1 Tax=Gracilibacillus halophilus YIM-C55.5 TaxID=1308866 RepID=N4WHC8_9BACI|nr:sulfur carrier protein ThiS [Gracilibacillus halophilus]ENH95577.1 sulfur carrier protein ThiS [Gracilibacillus halophilus YIM-C55.5]
MKLHINGDVIELEQQMSTVEELLTHLGLQEKPLIIEHNQSILKKEDHSSREIQDGDQFEIVHFVGGG